MSDRGRQIVVRHPETSSNGMETGGVAVERVPAEDALGGEQVTVAQIWDSRDAEAVYFDPEEAVAVARALLEIYEGGDGR